ncbi:MAG: PHB depolymerase family esterase [Sphingobacteriaceae bacterium]|nr:PHB depolymerase family esterase [Sphingobacteriaceae bacterium]
MKQYLSVLHFIFCLNTIFAQQTQILTEIDSFGNNPGNLKFFVHSKTSSTKLPLVVVLHGCGENAKAVSELTGWNKLADINEFIVIYPQQKLVNNPNLCFNWFANRDNEKGKGECESIFEMITFALKKYPIDTSKIFITGLSAGAAMSVVMTATHPELFKCGAIFAGGAYKIAIDAVDGLLAMRGKKYFPKQKLVKNAKDQNPNYKGKYPNMIIYQGLNDAVVNKKNALFLVNQWTGVNNIDTIADVIEPAFMNIEDIKRTQYTDSLGQTPVILYEVKNLGHKLLIKPGDKENEGGKKGMFGVDKGFHSTYQTAKEFGILKSN